jgi:hypothetical protein
MRVADYKVSLNSVDDGDKAAREQQLHACHQRSADKLLKLCFDNGGIYIKLGQHIGQLVSTARHSMQWSLGTPTAVTRQHTALADPALVLAGCCVR